MKPKIHVVMVGQGFHEEFNAISHEIRGFPGGTYHVFEVVGPNGVRQMFYNDFGVRLVQIDKL